jgi:hypothetical protein
MAHEKKLLLSETTAAHMGGNGRGRGRFDRTIAFASSVAMNARNSPGHDRMGR